MTKPIDERSKNQQHENQQAQQKAIEQQHRAEANEVVGRHKNDGQKDHKGVDKGPRGQ